MEHALKEQFFDACYNGDLKFIQEKITTGELAELMRQRDLSIFQSKTGFLRACEGGRTEVVRLLVAQGADISETDSCERTGLHLASRKGQVEVIRFLISVGANQLARDKDGWTPLHSACYEGQLQAVRELLGSGRKSFTCDEETLTNSLQLTPDCVINTPINVIASLNVSNTNNLNNAAQGNADNATPNTNICSDEEADAPAPTPSPLLYTVNPTNIKNNVGESALHIACTFADVELVTELILHQNSEVVINQQDNQGWTPLHRSCSKGVLPLVKFLVERGADIHLKTIFGSTCWDVAKAEMLEDFQTTFFEGLQEILARCRHA